MTIEEIAAREKTATPGRWTPSQDGLWLWSDSLFNLRDAVVIFTTDGRFPDRQRADINFAAGAREDIPYLLAQLEEAREKLAAVKDLKMALQPFAAFGSHIVPSAPDDDELLPDLSVAHFRNAKASWEELDRILKRGE